MKILSYVLLLLVACSSCNSNAPSVPKPKGYPRVNRGDVAMLKHVIQPFSFEYPSDAQLKGMNATADNQIWFNLVYPHYNATLYCSYITLSKGEYNKVIQDNKLLLEKAQANIYETNYSRPSDSLYGSFYTLEGNTMSPMQFYLTDSLTYFLRGSFYYSEKVNIDSIAPITKNLEQDIRNLMETFRVESTK